MRVLAIETSCDETAAAVVRDGRWVEGNAVASQIPLHQPYGGVVPEVASRAHVSAMAPVVREALEQADATWDAIDLVAATMGPGLAGSLLIGLNTAKGIAYGRNLPFLGVNHLEGHIYANWLTGGASPSGERRGPSPLPLGEAVGAGPAAQGGKISSVSPLGASPAGPAGPRPGEGVDPEPEFPLLCLIVSGGHSDLVLMEGHGDLRRIGRTLDDAAGEAFDKVARILGLGFPGGPIIQKLATEGNASRYPLPRAWLRGTYDFSFSGLKTATLHLVQRFPEGEVPVADVAAAFQESVADVLSAKAAQAARDFAVRQVAIAGGVAANSQLRTMVQERSPAPVRLPSLKYCTDNAAMIGSAAYYRWCAGARSDFDVDVQPNLPVA